MRLARNLFLAGVLLLAVSVASAAAQSVTIKALGIPLADHYAAIVAYEKYREQMQDVDFQLTLLPGPELVRAAFLSDPDVDLAFNVSPMVLDMFAEKPVFRWVSLIHRDGNALAINQLLQAQMQLPADKRARLPDERIANAIIRFKKEYGEPVRIAIPSALATHTTILYKYLRDHKLRFDFQRGEDIDVLLQVVKPPNSPRFLKQEDARARAAAFEQSLPWPELSESSGTGQVAWYSKDVLQHKQGHVECIIIAKDKTIRNKRAALQEVIRYIHRAGQDIENARRNGGPELDEIITIIQRNIPAHTRDAIIQTLRDDLYTINYLNLNVDDNAKGSLREIMGLALEAGFIRQEVDLDQLADDSFSIQGAE